MVCKLWAFSDPTLCVLAVKFAIDEMQRVTANCNGFILNLCISYGSRAEVVNACKSIAADVKNGVVDANDIGYHFDF